MPYQLNDFQLENRVTACRLNLRMLQDDSTLLQKTVTIDETWVSLYMAPDRNQQRSWAYPGEEVERTTAENIHGNKRLLIMAMDWDGICFWQLLPPKTTVNWQVYKKFLVEYLPNWISRNNHLRPWLLHDNARPHVHKEIKEFLAKKGITVWTHPPYSPDISPLDFCCFGQLKRSLIGIHHGYCTQFESALDSAVSDLNAREVMYGVTSLESRWKRVIEQEGAYL